MLISFLQLATSTEYETPTMGWSSWNTYRVHISEELIKKQATAMAEKGLKEKGYKYINIDDGYFGGRNETTGQLLINPERFPNGLEPVVTHIHNLGFKAGIYSDGGRNTCGNYYDADVLGKGVGLYAHDDQDADLFFNTLQFDFIKLDYCGGDPNQNSERLNLDEQTRYTSIRMALDKITRSIRVNVCRWAYPGSWVTKLATSWRISSDIENNFDAVKRLINVNMFYSAYAVEGHYNDMDMLEVGRGMSDDEDKTHFGMWCIMSSPLLIGCDMTTIKDSTLDLLKNEELIALNQDPLALQAQLVETQSNTFIFVKDILEYHSTTRAFAVYNPSDSEQTVNINFESLGLSGNIKVRDVYAKSDVGTYPSSQPFSVKVNKHGTRIFTISGETRLEQVRYEAENSWIERGSAITSAQVARVDSDSLCSLGHKVTYIGGNENDNYIEWRDVYSQNGGKYNMKIAFLSGEDRILRVIVNGKTNVLKLNAGSWTAVGTKTIEIELQKGSNVIRMDNPISFAPDIDYFEITPV